MSDHLIQRRRGVDPGINPPPTDQQSMLQRQLQEINTRIASGDGDMTELRRQLTLTHAELTRYMQRRHQFEGDVDSCDPAINAMRKRVVGQNIGQRREFAERVVLSRARSREMQNMQFEMNDGGPVEMTQEERATLSFSERKKRGKEITAQNKEREKRRDKMLKSNEALYKEATSVIGADESKTRMMQKNGLLSDENISIVMQLWNGEWGRKEWQTKKSGAGIPMSEVYQQCDSGNFQNYEHLDPLLRNALASRTLSQNQPTAVETPQSYANFLKQRGLMMNPAMRLGLSLASHGSEIYNKEPEFYKQTDQFCGCEIMLASITKVPSQMTDLEPAQREQVLEKQIFMAKQLLLCHIADFKRIDANGTEADWSADGTPVATAFTHCSRVLVTLPPLSRGHENVHSDFQRNFFGANDGEGMGMYRRMASTHDIKRKVVAGRPGGEIKEDKAKFNLSGQRGINVGIGGYGSDGVPGPGGIPQRITAEGRSGHIYLMQKEATAELGGSILMGYESDAPGYRNQVGHKHGAGNGEWCSSFLSQRCDEIGAKYGGRVARVNVDLSGVNDYLHRLETAMRNKFAAGASEDDLRNMLAPLVGTHMTPLQLSTFIFQTLRS